MRDRNHFSPSAAVIALQRNAINSSTRRTYDVAIGHYDRFCQQFGCDSSVISRENVSEWMASIAAEKSIKSSTFTTYCSGLSTTYIERGGAPDNNPFIDPRITRARDGVVRTLDEFSRSQPDRIPSPALTPDLLRQIDAHLRALGPQGKMMLAAAAIGVHAALRPGELLGSVSHPDRTPRPSSIIFYARAGSNAVAPLSALAPLPDRFTIDLGVTKTDQSGKRPPKACAAPYAVRALWEWMLLRQQRGETRPELFCYDSVPLRQTTLLRELNLAHSVQLGTDAHFTGKCFRRGLTSALILTASTADAQAAGAWRTAAMVAVYTAPEAAEAQRLAISRRS